MLMPGGGSEETRLPHVNSDRAPLCVYGFFLCHKGRSERHGRADRYNTKPHKNKPFSGCVQTTWREAYSSPSAGRLSSPDSPIARYFPSGGSAAAPAGFAGGAAIRIGAEPVRELALCKKTWPAPGRLRAPCSRPSPDSACTDE